ncbi:MAG: hypothetical protein WEA35_05575 [Candidatus Nanopelagicales bacterium]
MGGYFLVSSRGQRSRTWFGVSLILGGLAAGSAGISYQAFSYELKCAGRDFCALTNGYEIAYSLMQVASMSAMVVAVAYALASVRTRRAITVYAVLNLIVYVAVTVAGVLLPSAFLLSFEPLLLFAVPALGITESLWASGIYFSANDVLHVGMLAWLAITAWALGPALKDRVSEAARGTHGH